MSNYLTHERYNDGNRTTVDYSKADPIEFKVRIMHEGSVTLAPIPLDTLRAGATCPLQRNVLKKRLKTLESIISMDFDPSVLHVAALYLRRARNGSRYLDEVCPCYSHTTLEEHPGSLGFRAANGEVSTLRMPLYLTQDHADSISAFIYTTFADMVNVTSSGSSREWHDLWIPDMIAHLINQAIVDFSNGTVAEPAIQFVVDSLRFLVYCCEASLRTISMDDRIFNFPNLVPLMRKSILDFIQYPNMRTRNKVPDLGDLLQWVAVMELLDGSLTWKHLVQPMVVELFRRTARWVCKKLEKEASEAFRNPSNKTGKRLYGRHRTRAILAYAKKLGREELTQLWWESSRVGGRVFMYSHAFYQLLVEGRGLQGFKDKYDPVLGSVYPKDIVAVKKAQGEIEAVGSLSEMPARLGFPLSDGDIRRLCLWAIDAHDGYNKATQDVPYVRCLSDPSLSREKQQSKQQAAQKKTGGSPGPSSKKNRFAALAEISDDESDDEM